MITDFEAVGQAGNYGLIAEDVTKHGKILLSSRMDSEGLALFV